MGVGVSDVTARFAAALALIYIVSLPICAVHSEHALSLWVLAPLALCALLSSAVLVVGFFGCVIFLFRVAFSPRTIRGV